MNKSLLVGGMAALLSLNVHAQIADHDEAVLAAEQGHTRFWDYYTPNPTNPIGSSEWWEGENLTGDWWGIRNALHKEGVDIIANYTTNIAGNPVGGNKQGFTYTDNWYYGLQLDLEKLINWKGATFVVSGLDRNGTSLSQDYIGNQFTVQQIYGGQRAMFYALNIEQKLFDDKVSIKVGRFATGDDFASSSIYWLYMNNGIDGNPQSLPVNTQFSAYPWAVWAARLRIDPTPEYNGMLGIYQVSDRIFKPAYQGLDWSIRGNDSFMLIGQMGWTPEFFKREVDNHVTNEGKMVADGKAVKNMVEPAVMKGLPGHYWFGAYWSPWEFSQFGTSETASNSYGFYWHADQMVYQEAPGSDQGLITWTALTLSPQQNIAKLPFQVNGGLAYKGLIPTRDHDFTTLGVVYGKFSRNFARSVNDNGNGYPEYEVALEFGYKIQLSKFAFIQPDVQYIINPGGTGDIPNSLVLGAQMGVTF